jgi:hypothetical protein
MSKVILVVAAIIGFLVLIPIAEIWALNVLFPSLAIPLTFDTFLATIIITGALSGSTGLSFRSKN